MTEATQAPKGSACFEERRDVLLQELELAIRWRTPVILLIAYDSVYVRNDSTSMLENFLADHDQKVVWISAGDSVVNSLDFWHKILNDTDNVVFFIDGLGDFVNQRRFMMLLDHHAHLFTERRARLVFWLTFKEASLLAYQASDLWTRRQQLIELTAPPKPEQILQAALESAWQGTGEYGDQFEDTESKISLRESFLTDLPRKNETTSIRANLLLTLGILHWRKGDYEKANEMLQNALSISANMLDNWFDAKCFNAIALVKTSLGQNEDAIDSYKRAIRLAPDQIFAWNNLGNLCFQIGRNHEAMIAFQKAIEHNPSDPMAWNGIGNVYARSEYIDDAIAAYRKSTELAPSLPHPWNGLGEVYARSGRPNDAIVAFQNAIALNERFIQPLLGLANLYKSQNQYREASNAYQQALMIDPKNSSIWNDLGCAYLEAQLGENAIYAFNKAIELDRSFGWAYSNLGLAYANNNNIKGSIPLYQKSLDLLSDEQQRKLTWNRLANSYRMLGDYQSAIEAYQNADALHPGSLQVNDTASSGVHLESTSMAESIVETESTSIEDRSKESPVEETVIEQDQGLVDELPRWIFQSDEKQEDVPAQLFDTSSYLNSSELDGFITQPSINTQEIGGTSMQMILPITNKRVARPRTRTITNPRLNPQTEESDARVWNEKGNQLLRAGDYEEAIRAYNMAIKYDRYFGWAYTNLGITYLQMGKYAEAVLLLQKSLELLATDKEKAVAWNEMGNLYRCLNDYHNAVVSYQKADELDPEQDVNRDAVEYFHSEVNAGNAKVWNELGDAFFRSGSYTEASNCYRKVTEMVPLSGWAFNNLALSLTYQSRFKDAIPVYLKSIELFKTDKEKADTWNRLGNVFRRLNDYDNAVAAYKKAVKLNNEASSLPTRTRFSLLGNCTVD